MLSEYLPNVLEYSRDDAEIIIADNASTDDSVEWLHANYPHLRVITLDKNYGFAEGYNRALGQVESEYYLLLNSDVKVVRHWLIPLIEEMDAHPDIAACQPKLLSVFDEDSFEYAGASGGFLDRFGYPFCRGRIFETVEQDEGQYNTRKEILWATGACLLVRSTDYWAAGGLDGRFFAHNEEVDLCWRLHKMGRKIYCFPDSQVYHVGGATLPKSNSMKTFLNFRNNLTMLWKNLPAAELSHVMRVRCLLDYLAAFQMLVLKHNIADFKAVLKARRAFRKWRYEFRSREEIAKELRSGERTTRDGRTNYSILWSYYVKGHRKYDQLP